MCRAWDEAMNTQPNVLTWNVMGELTPRAEPCAVLSG